MKKMQRGSTAIVIALTALAVFIGSVFLYLALRTDNAGVTSGEGQVADMMPTMEAADDDLANEADLPTALYVYGYNRNASKFEIRELSRDGEADRTVYTWPISQTGSVVTFAGVGPRGESVLLTMNDENPPTLRQLTLLTGNLETLASTSTDKRLQSVRFSSDGARYAYATMDNLDFSSTANIFLVTAEDGETVEISEVPLGLYAGPDVLGWREDGQMLVSTRGGDGGGVWGELYLLEAEMGGGIERVPGPRATGPTPTQGNSSLSREFLLGAANPSTTHWAYAACAAPTGTFNSYCPSGARLMLYSLSENTEQEVYQNVSHPKEEHEGKLRSVIDMAWHRDDHLILSVPDGLLRVSVRGGEPELVYPYPWGAEDIIDTNGYGFSAGWLLHVGDRYAVVHGPDNQIIVDLETGDTVSRSLENMEGFFEAVSVHSVLDEELFTRLGEACVGHPPLVRLSLSYNAGANAIFDATGETLRHVTGEEWMREGYDWSCVSMFDLDHASSQHLRTRLPTGQFALGAPTTGETSSWVAVRDEEAGFHFSIPQELETSVCLSADRCGGVVEVAIDPAARSGRSWFRDNGFGMVEGLERAGDEIGFIVEDDREATRINGFQHAAKFMAWVEKGEQHAVLEYLVERWNPAIHNQSLEEHVREHRGLFWRIASTIEFLE